jgi:hypothetical protein
MGTTSTSTSPTSWAANSRISAATLVDADHRARVATTSRLTGPTRNGTTERSLEPQKNLTRKQEILARYQSDPVRSRSPLVDPERFYRNYVEMKDDPKTLDRKALFLTFLYVAQSRTTTDRSAAIISARSSAQVRTPRMGGHLRSVGRYASSTRCSARSTSTRSSGSRWASGWGGSTGSSPLPRTTYVAAGSCQ